MVVPGGLLARLKGNREPNPGLFAKETKRVEQMAMQAVTETEESLNYEPRDVSQENCGYDIESVIPESGKLRFIEVKGRIEDAKTVTVTKNEILTALNKPEDFILAVVMVPPSEDGKTVDPWQIQDSDRPCRISQNSCNVHYLRKPFSKEPDFNVTSVNYNLDELMANAEVPS